MATGDERILFLVWRLACQSKVISDLHGRLNLILVQTILARDFRPIENLLKDHLFTGLYVCTDFLMLYTNIIISKQLYRSLVHTL